jgi:hypothetical protein
MADEQELPDEGREGTPPPPPVKKSPAKNPAAKKAPAKKAPAKKAAAKKAPAKAPAKKAPAKKPAAAVAPPVPETNGSGVLADGPKQAAAQAKDTVEQASDLLAQPALAPAEVGRSPMPAVMALVISIIAVLLVRQLRRSGAAEDAD